MLVYQVARRERVDELGAHIGFRVLIKTLPPDTLQLARIVTLACCKKKRGSASLRATLMRVPNYSHIKCYIHTETVHKIKDDLIT